MTEHRKQDLRMLFEAEDSVTVTAVDSDVCEGIEHTFYSFDEAVVEIERLENTNTVYF